MKEKRYGFPSYAMMTLLYTFSFMVGERWGDIRSLRQNEIMAGGISHATFA